MLLPYASDEQLQVLDAIINNNNVIIDSVAGSGKTTCNLHIAKKFNEDNILLLTYNSRLKIETREKVKMLKIKNIETHSYHSFCVKYYNPLCFTDSEIIKILDINLIPIKDFKYEIIILDETQDMTPILFKLVCKIFKDNNYINPKICILGDERQCIFDFNNADKRFITLAEKIFTSFNTFSWKHLKLTTSFRISFEMSEFINNCMLNKIIITSNKISSIKPRYIFWEPYHKFNRAFHEIKYYLNLGYKPSDIFVLAPSVRCSKSPIRKIENKIKTNKDTKDVPVFVPISDDIELDKDIIENKLVFSTFHQTKGLERKVVLIIGFDNSYFEYYKKNYNTYHCPNELYVAATRSLEHLSLFHTIGKDWLDFLKTDDLSRYCEIMLPSYFIKLSIDFNKKNIHNVISVTDLLRHIPSEIIDKCWEYIKVENKRENGKQINIPTKIKKYGSELDLYEEVSEITGTAIPEYFEYLLTNKMSIFENIIKYCGYDHRIIKNYETINNTNFKNNFSIENLNASKILQLANIWNAYKSEFLFKLYQINDYTWLSEENLTLCIERLKTLNINVNNLKFEIKNNINILNVPIVGYIDCINNDNIYEFKCVKALKKEHYIQLALYKYMYETLNYNKKDVNNYYLYNILSDELIKLISSHTDVFKIIKILIEYKYKKILEISDDVFLLNIANIINSANKQKQ